MKIVQTTIPSRYIAFDVVSHTTIYDTDSDKPLLIPIGVTKICDNFLCGCNYLTKPPIIPNSVTSIGNEFLARCSNLNEPPRIPNSVTTIGDEFLDGCYNLKEPPIFPYSVTLGDSFLGGEGHFPFALAETFYKWCIDELGSSVTYNMSNEYWQRKRHVKTQTLVFVLDIPCHIIYNYVL